MKINFHDIDGKERVPDTDYRPNTELRKFLNGKQFAFILNPWNLLPNTPIQPYTYIQFRIPPFFDEIELDDEPSNKNNPYKHFIYSGS